MTVRIYYTVWFMTVLCVFTDFSCLSVTVSSHEEAPCFDYCSIRQYHDLVNFPHILFSSSLVPDKNISKTYEKYY